MARLELTLLGGFHAQVKGGPAIAISTRKTRALLAYLALPPGRPHARETLVSLLWSDRGEKQAHASLRQALVELIRALDSIRSAPLLKEHNTIALKPEAVEMDVALFEQLASGDSTADLERAATLYSGDLLEGLSVRDAAFEEWLLFERQRLRNRALAVLKRLLELQTGSAAIATAERLVTLDPLQEEGHRVLMRIHADAGELGLALRQYEICRDVLRRELDVEPSSATEALHQEIRSGRYGKGLELQVPSMPAPTAVRSQSSNESLSLKPSLAVLPFANLSGDPDQRYLSDGISEDLIIELSRFRSLTVIARNSTFLYQDKSVDVRQIGQELGAEYILEGSVRRVGDRIRIAAELVETVTGSHLWAERYDREHGNLFAVQDAVIEAIVATLPGRIEEAGGRAAQRKRPENLNAYDWYLRGLAQMYEFEFAESQPARDMFERAIALDPTLAPAHMMLGVIEMRFWWAYRSLPSLDKAFTLAQKAVQLDANNGHCQRWLGNAYLEMRQFDNAAFHLRRALTLNPNDPGGAVNMASLLAYCGQPGEALTWINKAFRVNPFAPQWYHSATGMVLFCARDYEKAVLSFLRITRGVSYWDCLYVIASHGYLNQREDAEATIAHYDSLKSGLSLMHHASREPFKAEADLKHLLEGLRRAGVRD